MADYSKFGFYWLCQTNAESKHRLGFNVYVSFKLACWSTKRVFETELYIFDKDISFDDCFTILKQRYGFPNIPLEYQFYTDNRTVVPKEFIGQLVKKKEESQEHKQLTMF